MPNIEFEIIDIDNAVEDTGARSSYSTESPTESSKKPDTDNDLEDEYDFPLFSTTKEETTLPNVEVDEDDRGRPTRAVMKVSLRDASPELVKLERPQSYYFAHYSLGEKKQFEEAAITLKVILRYSDNFRTFVRHHPAKSLDLGLYNEKVEEELKREAKHKRKRPGKKKRMNKILCRQRNEERRRDESIARKKNDIKLMKKIFHKRGGKKHKKKVIESNSKPKYRTE